MARKKTRKQKKAVAVRRMHKKLDMTANVKADAGKLTYNLEGIALETRSRKARLEKKKEEENLFDYDPGLLMADIRKTVILSMVVFGMQIGLWWYLQ